MGDAPGAVFSLHSFLLSDRRHVDQTKLQLALASLIRRQP